MYSGMRTAKSEKKIMKLDGTRLHLGRAEDLDLVCAPRDRGGGGDEFDRGSPR